MDALNVLCAQLMRDLFAIAKLLLMFKLHLYSDCCIVFSTAVDLLKTLLKYCSGLAFNIVGTLVYEICNCLTALCFGHVTAD